MTSVPHYLQRPAASKETFAKLTKKDNEWRLSGDPQVIVMAKRLFPGSQGRGAGVARFPATPRIMQDLVWLMHRWPIEIVDEAAFDADYERAVSHYHNRVASNKCLGPSSPGVNFTGKLRPFQEEGLSWMLANPRTLLADEMGLGKTVQALAYLATQPVWPVLIVPPPHLMRHWHTALKMFLQAKPLGKTEDLFGHNELSYHTLRGLTATPLPQAHIYLCHYLILRAWRTEIKAVAPERVVFDEIQELRKAGSEKYSAASFISADAQSVIGLSGTPIYNAGGEIWNVLNAVEYHCLADWDSFTREWCAGYGSDIVKSPDTLNTHLKREGLMLRRKKADVLTELPDKRRVVESVDSDSSLFWQLAKEAVELAKSATMTEDVLARGRLEREALSATRKATGVAKAKGCSAFIRGLLDAKEPTLVFAHHHDVFDILGSELKDFTPSRISGRETEAQKAAAMESFQEGRTDLCFVSLRSATGLDGLQARARVVVFVELDWSPAVHTQAEDRAHRMGQHDSVLCYYLVSDCGSDPDIMDALGLKIAQFTGIMGDAPESEDERKKHGEAAKQHIRNIMDRLKGHR